MDTFKLRILHISDLHERGSREPSPWRRRRVLGKEWEQHLDALLEDGAIQLVCFTGDVADWGKAAEYGPVTEFLQALLARLKLPLERLFVVPGNHDIDRTQNEASWKLLRQNLHRVPAREVSDWLAGGKHPPLGFQAEHREQLLSRQAAYRAWLGTELGRKALLPEFSPHGLLGYRSSLRIEPCPFDIHLVGLDSAWACGDDNDAGKILLTDEQVGKLTTDEKGKQLSGFRLALVHHPLTELADSDECRRLIADNVDLLLRGHRHRGEVETWISPDHTARQLAAGCLYEGHGGDQWPNACHVIEATLDQNGRPQCYDLRFRGWSPSGFWHDDNSLYRDSRDGRLQWRVVAKPVEPHRPPQAVFVGREEELRRLAQAVLPEGRQPVAINGMPGVGKTYLAERFFLANRNQFPGGLVQLALNPEAPASTPTLLGQLADRFELPAAAPALAARVHQRLLTPLTLLLIENVDSAAGAQVAVSLAEQIPGCAVLVTGRFSGLAHGAGWAVIDVQPLDHKTALEQLAREWRPPRVGERPEYVRLVDALGCLPLALHLAAGYLRFDHTIEGFLTKLHATELALTPVINDHLLRPGQDRARAALRSTFELSLGLLRNQLGADAARLLAGFESLGEAPPSGFGRSLGAALAGLTQPEFDELIPNALLLSLVTRVPGAERQDAAWRIHPLLAELLRTRLGTSTGLSRITEWFVARLPELPPAQGTEQGTRWKELQQENAALVSWLPRVPEGEFARVERAGTQYAGLNGPFTAWMGFCERALLASCTSEGRSNLLWTLTQVAQSCGASDRALAAALEKAELDRQRCDERGQALAAGVRADVLQARGELDEALRIRQEEQLPVFEKLDDPGSRAVTLGQIADVLQSRGQVDEALRIRQQEQLPVFEKLGDVRSRAVTLGKIADILQSRGQFDEALRILQQELLPVFETLGDVRSRAVTLGKIADVLQARGQLDEALRIRQQEVLPVFETLGDVRERAVTLGQIADVLQARGKLDEALHIRQQEELPTYEKLGDVRERAVTLGKIADVLQARGQLDEALRILQQEVLPVFEKLGDVRSRAITLGQIAAVFRARGQLDEALRIHQDEELPVYAELGDVYSLLVARTNLALVHLKRSQPGDREIAANLLRLARDAADSLGLPEAQRMRDIQRENGLEER